MLGKARPIVAHLGGLSRGRDFQPRPLPSRQPGRLRTGFRLSLEVMNDNDDAVLDGDTEPIAATRPVAMPRIPEERMPPITCRFLFVDVSSRRAKQLRRGALPRLEALRPDPETGQRPEVTSRLERVAMEEVEQGLVVYDLIEDKSAEETT